MGKVTPKAKISLDDLGVVLDILQAEHDHRSVERVVDASEIARTRVESAQRRNDLLMKARSLEEITEVDVCIEHLHVAQANGIDVAGLIERLQAHRAMMVKKRRRLR